MKKKFGKKLTLNKTTISNLSTDDWARIKGGTGTFEYDIPTIDIPTFHDSCFTACDFRCNDYPGGDPCTKAFTMCEYCVPETRAFTNCDYCGESKVNC